MNDRYKFSQFYKGKGTEIQYAWFQTPTDEVYHVENLGIVTLAMDFPAGTSTKERKEIEKKWIEILPTLHNVKVLNVRHRISPDFFEAICQMHNLEQLYYWSSTLEDITGITRLIKLRKLKLCSFSRLLDISSIKALKNLTVLSIENCFKVTNYQIVGELIGLEGLELCGDKFAPRKLMLNSLKPFTALKKLKHLDLSTASVRDKSYEYILEMENLERLDLLSIMPGQTRDKIKSNHKNLKAGFFMDYNFELNEFYDVKNWDVELIRRDDN